MPFTRKEVQGVPLIDPLTALSQSASMLPLVELIIAIDHLIRIPRGLGYLPPLVDGEELRSRVRTSQGSGVRSLRAAIPLVRDGAESRMETLTRLLLEAYGLACYFELQVEVADSAGRIGRFDLVCVDRKVIVEYDGDQHRTDQAQYRRDLLRIERAHAAGYTVIRLVSEDVLYRPAATAARIAAALGAPVRAHRLKRELIVVR